MAPRRLPYSGALERWDTAAIRNSLADDVVIHVAVHDEPLRGKEVAGFLFGVLSEELRELTVTEEIVEDVTAVVLFTTSVGDLSAQGLNVIRFDDSGAIGELTVFFRPLAALGRIAEVVGGRMAERFGPPPG